MYVLYNECLGIEAELEIGETGGKDPMVRGRTAFKVSQTRKMKKKEAAATTKKTGKNEEDFWTFFFHPPVRG